jgi:hypothetical protein
LETLEKNSPKIKKAIHELKILSQDKKARAKYEDRLKAEMDYNSGIHHAFTKGKSEGEQIGIQKGEQIGIQKGEQIGIQKGSIDTLHLSIEMTLRTKFKAKGLALFPKIKKIKDLTVLTQILEIILKAKDLREVKKMSEL